MNRPLVVNTRPAEQAAELSQLLRDAGFEPFEAPAIFTTAAFEPAELGPIPDEQYAWLVLQSRNAARFYLEADGSENVFQRTRVLCGAATARALRLPFADTLDPFSAAAALDWLQSRVHAGERVLIPRAADGRDELISGLRERGVEVDAPVVYRTQPASPSSLDLLLSRLQTGDVAAITFCSPSAVDAVAAAASLTATPCVSLGQTTTAALAAHGLRAAAVADRTSMHSLVAAVRKALAGMDQVA